MKLELVPGRRCLIVPWCPIVKLAGKECVLNAFCGEAMFVSWKHGVVFYDIWDVEIDEPPPAGFVSWGCRAVWLIPLAGGDEGEQMFSLDWLIKARPEKVQ